VCPCLWNNNVWITCSCRAARRRAFLLSPYTIQFPTNSFSGMEIEEELTSVLPALDREKIFCIEEHLMDVIGAEDLKPFLTPIQIRKLLLAFKGGLSLIDSYVTDEPFFPHHTILHMFFENSLGKISTPTVARGDRAHPEDRRSMVRIVVEAMQVHSRNPKHASCEEVAQIIVNRYPETFAGFTEKGERLGCGHYSLLRSIKSRVEHVNRDNTTHRLFPTVMQRHLKKVRCFVDSYGCINWQPLELPEGETLASLEETKDILLTIFNSQGPGAKKKEKKKDVDDFMCLTYISQCAEIQEHEHLSQTLKTKGRRIVNYFSSQKLKWKLGIRTLLQQIESEDVLTNNNVGTAAMLLMMKYYKENEDSLFVLADETSTRMSFEAESNLPITPRLIMLGQSLMTATCWMVSAKGRVIVELDKENTFADAMSVFFGSFYVLNLDSCVLYLFLFFFVRINPEEGTKCTSKVGTSRRTGTTQLTEFEWKTSN
uniref:Uncharacterized protein n=1 Tax=Maylandia zebra TaxID=106582 RepID=A0A3P9DIQ3_9CICH